MRNKKSLVLAVAMLMTVSSLGMVLSVSDKALALTPDNGMQLEYKDPVLYVSGGINEFTFGVVSVPTGYTAGNIVWEFRNLGDGTNIANFVDSSGAVVTNPTGQTAKVRAVSQGTIEVVAKIVVGGSAPDLIGAGYAVILQSPGAAASVFHFFVRIDYSALPSGVSPTLPTGYTQQNFENGVWITVTSTQVTGPFNAISALSYYCTTNNWSLDAASSGWINTFLGLGTYSGGGGAWIYWAQYHLVGNGTNRVWEFNSTAMGYITTQDHSLMGLIFWNSPSASATPPLPPAGTIPV